VAGGAFVIALSLGATGCNHVDQLSFAPAPAQVAVPTTAVPVTLADGTGVRLPRVPGSPTTTVVPVVGGVATITGTVVGPGGVLPGATVYTERVVGSASGSITAITGPDGGFSLTGLLGGAYRVRAWDAPTLAMTTPMIFFLPGTGQDAVTLSLATFDTVGVVGVTNPDPPVVGQPANLAIQVTMPLVGADGVVRHLALPAATVVLTNDPAWKVRDTPTMLTTTGADGEAVFEVICTAPGSQTLYASVNSQDPLSLNVPACRAAPPPTTTTTAPTPKTTALTPKTTTLTLTTRPPTPATRPATPKATAPATR
jgi:hypothetical protein